jgi:hypothetical protein
MDQEGSDIVLQGKTCIFSLKLCEMKLAIPIFELVRGMKPWLAFFTIWSVYLKKTEWKYSVYMESCGIG